MKENTISVTHVLLLNASAGAAGQSIKIKVLEKVVFIEERKNATQGVCRVQNNREDGGNKEEPTENHRTGRSKKNPPKITSNLGEIQVSEKKMLKENLRK